MGWWFIRVVRLLVAAILVLTLTNAIINGGQGAWLSVAGIAVLLVALFAREADRPQ